MVSSRNRSKKNNNPDKYVKRESQTVGKTGKRLNYLSWEDYFMGIAFLSGQRSKDPVTQVGACIVDKRRRIVGMGYNGMPDGCHDDIMPWGKDPKKKLNNKNLYVCHAEQNAILNKHAENLEGCTIYVSLFPCNNCAKLVIQSGIKEVVYCSNKYHKKAEFRASRDLMETAGIKFRQHRPKQSIMIDFSSIEPKRKQRRARRSKWRRGVVS